MTYLLEDELKWYNSAEKVKEYYLDVDFSG